MSDEPKWILPDTAPRPVVVNAPEPLPTDFTPKRATLADISRLLGYDVHTPRALSPDFAKQLRELLPPTEPGDDK